MNTAQIQRDVRRNSRRMRHQITDGNGLFSIACVKKIAEAVKQRKSAVLNQAERGHRRADKLGKRRHIKQRILCKRLFFRIQRAVSLCFQKPDFVSFADCRSIAGKHAVLQCIRQKPLAFCKIHLFPPCAYETRGQLLSPCFLL